MTICLTCCWWFLASYGANLFPFHAPILEPDFYLPLRQTQTVCDLDPPPPRQVAIKMELLLQFQCLVARIRRSLAFRLSIGVDCICFQCQTKFRPLINRWHRFCPFVIYSKKHLTTIFLFFADWIIFFFFSKFLSLFHVNIWNFRRQRLFLTNWSIRNRMWTESRKCAVTSYTGVRFRYTL